jgi:hypothetical protein
MSVVSTDYALTPAQVGRISQLRAAIRADFEPELVLACKYAVLTAAGYRRAEIRRMLGEPSAEVVKAEQRVKACAERLDHGD